MCHYAQLWLASFILEMILSAYCGAVAGPLISQSLRFHTFHCCAQGANMYVVLECCVAVGLSGKQVLLLLPS